MTATASRENRWASAGGATAAPGRPSGGLAAPAQAAPAEPAKPSKLKSKKFLIMVVVGVLVVGGLGYKMFGPKPKYVPAAGEVVALEPTTVNLADGHYLKVTLKISLLKEKASAAAFETSAAEELLIDEFANRSMPSLSSNPAREKLKADLMAKLAKQYPNEIFEIRLTQFVMQ